MSVKVGDKVRITKADKYVGDVCTVKSIEDDYVYVDHPRYCALKIGNFEIVTKEGDDSMQAQVGDLIRVTNSEDAERGAIFEVVAVDGDVVEVNGTFADGSELIFFEHEYVIHRKAGEEDSEETSESKRVSTCDYCGSNLGEIACSTHLGGAFCSAKCSEMYVKESEAKMAEEVERFATDAVNHPNHYTQGKFETIEIIEEITKGYSDGYVAYCVGNALKYLARAPFKHGEPTEDLAKAGAYIRFASDYLNAKSTQK